jgi:hypothetical protein
MNLVQEAFELIRTDNDVKVGTGAKHGFCFYDNWVYNLSLLKAPQNPRYVRTDCGTMLSLSVTMGLSVGWGDKYGYTLPTSTSTSRG